MLAFGHNLEEIAAALGSAVAHGWRSTLEVLILTVGIYYVLRFIRGTRGAPVVTGFLVVLLTFALASFLLQLKVLQYLFGAFSAFSLLAVLAIFQPELRRLLAELGNLPLFATAHEQRENIEVIIQTVERLADVRIGALDRSRTVYSPSGSGRIRHHRRAAKPPPRCSKPLLPQQRHPRRWRDHQRGQDRLRRLHLSPDPAPGSQPVAGHAAPGGDRTE